MLEVFVFIATFALFVEFPATQDLIYTKICIQTLLEYKFDIKSPDPISTSTRFPPNFPEQSRNSTLPSNGRIQELDVSPDNATSLLTSNNLFQFNRAEVYSLCNHINNTTTIPNQVIEDIRKLHSKFWLKYQLIISVLCALASPYWGGVSDRIGLLIPLNVPILASLVCNLFSLTFGILMSLDLHALLSINWLLSGAVIVGLSGGQAVFLSNAYSFLVDNIPNEDRTKRATILESTTFLAQSLGFFLSQLIMHLDLKDQIWKNRHFVTFGLCITLNSACLVYSICNLRHRKFHRFLNNFEREQQEAASSNDMQGANKFPSFSFKRAGLEASTTTGERMRELTASTPDDLDGPIARSDKSNWTFWDIMLVFRYYKETYSTAMKPRESRAIILLLLLAGFISAFSLATLMSLLFIYVKNEPFRWTPSQYSTWNSLSSIVRGVALVVLTLGMKFYPGWNVPDPLVAMLGFISKASGLLLIGLSQSSTLLYCSLACFVLSEYTMPPIRSLLSKLVVNDELCKVYSCLGSLQSICFILGNIIYLVFNYVITRKDLFRLSFIVASAFEFAAAVIMLNIYTLLRRRILVA